MRLSWRGTTGVLGSSTAAGYAAEGHLVAFAPLQLRALGMSDVEVGVWSGVLYAATIAASLPLGPFWGVLAERYSRRAIIARSWLVLAATLLVAAWAPNLGWLIFSRVLFGLSYGSGAVVASTQALLTPREHVGRAIAMVQAAQPIAGSLGPVFGAFIIPQLGIAGLFGIDAGLILISTVVLLLIPEPDAGPRPSSIVGRAVEMVRYAWSNRQIRWTFTAQMLARGATTVVDAYLPVRITQLAAQPASAIGWTLGAYGLLTTLVTWAAGGLVDRGLGRRAFTLAMWFGAAVALGLVLAPWLGLVSVLAVLLAVPNALARLVILTHLAQVVPRERQTSIFGLSPTSGNVGALIFPLLASAAATVGGTAAAMTVAVFGYGLTGAAGVRLGRLSGSKAPQDDASATTAC